MRTSIASSPTLDLCCGGKKCPVLRDEGSTFVIEDPDQSDKPIRVTREQAEQILNWLDLRLSIET